MSHSGMKIVNVKVVQCKSPLFWYADMVGKIIEVYKDTNDYICKEDYDRGPQAAWGHIKPPDCIEVSDDELNTIEIPAERLEILE